jgi:uncharacterized protein
VTIAGPHRGTPGPVFRRGAVARETPRLEQARGAAAGCAAAGPTPADAVARETPRGRPALSRALAAVVLAPIRAYRRWISPLLGPRCRYYPTCSAYAEQAVRELGVVRGTILAVWRVLRCNPLSSGGLDPLENRRLFRSEPPAGGGDHPEASD